MIIDGYGPPPKLPKCQIRREDVSPIFPRDIKKYRIIKKNVVNITENLGGYQPTPKPPTFNVQLNIGFLFLDKWVDIGPTYCDTVEEAYDWILKTVYPPSIEPEEQVIWSGKYSQTPPHGV